MDEWETRPPDGPRRIATVDVGLPIYAGPRQAPRMGRMPQGLPLLVSYPKGALMQRSGDSSDPRGQYVTPTDPWCTPSRPSASTHIRKT